MWQLLFTVIWNLYFILVNGVFWSLVILIIATIVFAIIAHRTFVFPDVTTLPVDVPPVASLKCLAVPKQRWGMASQGPPRVLDAGASFVGPISRSGISLVHQMVQFA